MTTTIMSIIELSVQKSVRINNNSMIQLLRTEMSITLGTAAATVNKTTSDWTEQKVQCTNYKNKL